MGRRVGAARILIADDDETLCEVVAAALELAGYATRQAGTREEVLRALDSQWSLILLDTLDAPLGDPAQRLLAEICNRADRTPVLLMTGSLQVAAWAKDSLPIVGVLAKPFDLEPFLTRVAALVSSAPS